MSGKPSRSLLLWCAPAFLLGAALLAFALVRAGPSLTGALLALLVVAPTGWVLVSALWPARAERRCPACAADALARSDPHASHGLVCRACGWRDESASAWLLAEEEGALEELVLSERRRRRASAPRLDSRRRRG